MYKYQLIFFISAFVTCIGHLTFSNLKCASRNQSYVEFTECYIKAVNRSHKYINVYARLYHRPLTNITINLKLMRYNHGYKPLFFDVTYDACRFLRTLRNPIAKRFYDEFKKCSNMNHTCPYDTDLILNQMWTQNIETSLNNILSLANGEYALFTTWYSYNVERVTVNIYFKLTAK